jgi:hypothetical protein
MGNVNIQGEDQKKLDIIANRIMKNTLCCSGNSHRVASEEENVPCLCSEVTDNAAFSGDYVIFLEAWKQFTVFLTQDGESIAGLARELRSLVTPNM